MKKLTALLALTALILTLFTGCGSAAPDRTANIANPVTEMASVEEINDAVGCAIKSMKDHYDYGAELIDGESFSLIDGEPQIAQYSFSLAGIPVCLRAGHSKDDISGIYMDEGKHPADFLDEEKYYDPIDTGSGIWTRWFLGGMQYCLTVGDGRDYSIAMEKVYCDNLVTLCEYLRDYFAYETPWYMEPYYTYEYEGYAADGWEYGEDYGYINESDYVFSEEKIPCDGAKNVYEELLAKNTEFGTDFGRGAGAPFSSLENYETSEHGNVVTVDNINDFLAAIAPDTEIILAPGEYVVSDAEDYSTGSGEYYYWEEFYDGWQLNIRNVDNFAVTGSFEKGEPATVISTEPRYAEVLCFSGCTNIELGGLVMGHTENNEGYCTGSVLFFDSCTDVSVTGCELYGCGTYGTEAIYSDAVSFSDCVIRSCTLGHVYMSYCGGVSFTGCSFLCTNGYTGSYYYGCDDILYENCDFAHNRLRELFLCEGTGSVTLTNIFAFDNSLAAGIFNGTSAPYVINGGAEVDSVDPSNYWGIAFG